MKILFVGTHHGGGGTESHLITLSLAMLAEGHEVAAVVQANTPIARGLNHSDVRLYFGKFRNAFDPRGWKAVWSACSEFQPDWIVGSFSKEYWPLAIISRLRGIKLCLFKHMDYKMRFMTHHLIPRLAQRFVVISEFMRGNFIARGVDPTRISLLYNPLDLSHFQPDAELRRTKRAELGFAEDDIVVGFISAMHPDKGMLPLVDALNLAIKTQPKLKAIWVGNGLAVAELKNRIAQGGFADHHHYFEWTQNVLPYYAVLDIFAVPSLSPESFGRVSIEAQALGIPVLCSNRGGLPETLDNEITGQLLPAGEVSVWRDALLNLANNPALRQTWGQNGRPWVLRKFGTQIVARQFSELLNSVETKKFR
jgi:glycosyltransferase involved in cell wall biosynthesis